MFNEAEFAAADFEMGMPMLVGGMIRLGRRWRVPPGPVRPLIDELFEPARQAELERLEALVRAEDEEILLWML